MVNNTKFDQATPEEKQFAETASILPVWNPQWRTDHVRHLACEAKNADERSKGRPGDSTRCCLGYINRWALNLLRHKYTNYDRLLKEFGRESPYVTRRLKHRITAMALETWPDLEDITSDAKWDSKIKPKTNTRGKKAQKL